MMRLSVLLVLSLFSCSPSGGPADLSTVTIDTLAQDQSLPTDIDAPKPLPDLSGTVYRAVEFVATAPTDKLNEAWAGMVEEHSLAVVFVVTDHDMAAQTLTLQLTSAWIELTTVDGIQRPTAYRFGLEPVTVTLLLDGLDFVVEETFSIDLFPMSVNKPFHIHGARGEGRLSPDGQGIDELRLEGYLAEAQIGDFCLHMPGLGDVNLHWFMNLAGICATADSDGDGAPDSYLFKGFVRADVEAELYQPGIHPIEPQITDCPVHDDPCTPSTS